MLKFPCLVLDHDETVVQSEKTIGYPCFCQTLSRIRPGQKITLDEYVRGCHDVGFVEMCRTKWQFSDAELREEYQDWMEYVQIHVPEPFPGIDRIIHRQREEGGIICVVSHSSSRNITRDYAAHFGIQPDAIYGCDLPEELQKPNPYPLKDIMRRYQLRPDELLVVDDMKLAWRMAAPLGVPIAFAAWGKADFPELAREMRDLCDFAFDTTLELEKFIFGA